MHDRALRRIAADIELVAFSPDEIQKLAMEYVEAGGIIHQIKEQRPEYNDYDFYYKLIVPVPDFVHGLFIEMRMTDPDAECPTVRVVNAHPQRK